MEMCVVFDGEVPISKLKDNYNQGNGNIIIVIQNYS